MYPSYVPYPLFWPQGYPVAANGQPPGQPGGEPRRPMPTPAPGMPPQLPLEESYIENILRLNLGKMVTIYMTFENNAEWNAKIFRGRLEAAGKDHIIISDPRTGKRYLLLMVNVDWIEFDEPLRYFYPPRVP
ncbi:MAG TPA: spore coat protein GerQ [Calditerricola sp.]